MNALLNLLSTSASSGTQPKGGYDWVVWVILIGLCVVMFVISSRQRKKQQAQMEERMNALSAGDRIKTIGLIVGVIERVNEDGTLLISTGDANNKTYLTIEKNAVYQTIPDEEPAVEVAEDIEAIESESTEEGIEIEDIIEEATADEEENNN